MTPQQIKDGAPDGANGYEEVDGKVYYFIDDFWIWDEGAWSLCIFTKGHQPNIKPL